MSVFTPEEQAVWQYRADPGLVAWSEEYVELSRLTSAAAGRYSFDMVPFYKGIAEAIDSPNIRKINIRKPTQLGGTQLVVNAICHWADTEPAPAMFCMADEDTAIEICKYRIQPTIERVPLLRSLINRAKFNESEILLNNDFRLVMAWASSIAKTASRPIRYLIMDEITKDGYNRTGKEGDSITRILQRTETFDNKKIILLSTVTAEGDNMYRQEEASEELYLYFIPCPHCGTFQPLFFRETEYIDQAGNAVISGSVKWEGEATTAYYECNSCKEAITTIQKNNVCGQGLWVPQRNNKTRATDITFAISRLYSLFPGGRFESLAKDFIDCKEDNLKLQAFVNNSLAEYWKHVVKKVNRNALINAIDASFKANDIPDPVVALVMTVDVQKHGFWYVIRGWAQNENSWLIQYGYVKTWEELDKLCFDTRWNHKAGSMPIWRIGIDTGGGVRATGESSADEVYAWILVNRYRGADIYPCKGSSKALPTKCKMGAPLQKSKAGSVGIRLLMIDAEKCKDSFFYRLECANREGAIASYVHRDTGKEYFDQLCAEEKRFSRKTGRTEWIRIHKNNHYLDVEAMQLALVDPVLSGGIAAIHDPIVIITKQAQTQAPKPGGIQQQNNWQKQQNPWKAGR